MWTMPLTVTPLWHIKRNYAERTRENTRPAATTKHARDNNFISVEEARRGKARRGAQGDVAQTRRNLAAAAAGRECAKGVVAGRQEVASHTTGFIFCNLMPAHTVAACSRGSVARGGGGIIGVNRKLSVKIIIKVCVCVCSPYTLAILQPLRSPSPL